MSQPISPTTQPWRISEEVAGSLLVSFDTADSGGGARLTLPAAPRTEVYHQQLMQDLQLEGGRSYELCAKLSASAASADAGLPASTVQMAIDSGAPVYAVPESKPRLNVQLPPDGSTVSGCFAFELRDSISVYSGRVVLGLGFANGEIGVCELSLRACALPLVALATTVEAPDLAHTQLVLADGAVLPTACPSEALVGLRLQLNASTLPTIGVAPSNVRRVAFYARMLGEANFLWIGEDDGTINGRMHFGVTLEGIHANGVAVEHYALIFLIEPNASKNNEVNTLFQRARSVAACSTPAT